MDGTEHLLGIYGVGFTVSLMVCLAGAALAVFCWFRFSVRQIIALRSGSARKKFLRRIQEKHGERVLSVSGIPDPGLLAAGGATERLRQNDAGGPAEEDTAVLTDSLRAGGDAFIVLEQVIVTHTGGESDEPR